MCRQLNSLIALFHWLDFHSVYDYNKVVLKTFCSNLFRLGYIYFHKLSGLSFGTLPKKGIKKFPSWWIWHYKKSDVSLNVQEHKIWHFTAFPAPFR